MAEYVTHQGEATSQNLSIFLKEWGIDENNEVRGGIEAVAPQVEPPHQGVVLLQRKESEIGAGLVKTTG